MNRRGFIGSIAGLAAGLVLPKPAFAWGKVLAPFEMDGSVGFSGWKFYDRAVNLNEDWICVVHPDCARDLLTIRAKDKWAHAYRAWRMDGRPEMSARELLAKYAVNSSELYNAELGTVGGIKIITQELVRPFTV